MTHGHLCVMCVFDISDDSKTHIYSPKELD